MLNEFTDSLQQDYPPTLAIMVYEGHNDFYLESHEIVSGQIMEGKPLAEETIFGIAELFKEKGITQCNISGIFPGNLLHFEKLNGSDYNMIWYRPAEQRIIHFSESLCIPDGQVWVPPLIYQAKGRTLTVMALESDDRPALNTILLKPPFHNTNGEHGSVCLGSAKARRESKRTFGSEIEYWETLFWQSKFSHLSGNNPTKGNLNLIWMNQVSKGTKFPMDELLPSKLTLKNLL